MATPNGRSADRRYPGQDFWKSNFLSAHSMRSQEVETNSPHPCRGKLFERSATSAHRHDIVALAYAALGYGVKIFAVRAPCTASCLFVMKRDTSVKKILTWKGWTNP